MGSTVFKEAKLFSFPTQSGRVGYVWAEETYERKEGPRLANWCVMGIGYREQMIERIFGLASSIPGGMLKVSQSSAKNFITAMLKQFDAPLKLNNTKFDLENADIGFYSAITDENRSAVQALLTQAGKEDLATAAALSPKQGGAKRIPIDLATDLDLVVALTSRRIGQDSRPLVLPWRIISHRPYGDDPGIVEDASAMPWKARIDLQVMRADLGPAAPFDEKFLCVLDGQPIVMASGYEVEQTLIRHAATQEAARPGYYKPLLSEYAAQRNQECELVPDETVFEVDASSATSWARSTLEAVANVIHGEEQTRFAMTMRDISRAVKAATSDSEQDSWTRFYLPQSLTYKDAISIRLPEVMNQTDLDDEGDGFVSAPVRLRGG